MKLKEIINKLDLEVVVGEDIENREVQGVYICDLLSNVMAHGKQNDLWITIQTHQNIVAVASLLNFAGILIPEGLQPDDETLEKAKKEGVVILKSSNCSYDLAGQIYEMGLRGDR